MSNPKQLTILSLVVLLASVVTSDGKPRHIVFIVADDLGWNDVGFHNPDMITPNIDRLARGGVILNSSYVQPVCTPSRHSVMTGIYPFKVGLQRGVIMPEQASCSPLNLTFFPKQLQKLGYATHAIGKWHLGSCKWECTPTFRGFDTFLGYYNGMEDYYNKTLGYGIDFHDGMKPITNNEYSPLTYAKRAVEIISQHPQDTPLFLYLPFQSVHSPIQVPQKYEDMYPHIKSEGRRQYSGMVSAMDEAIGSVTTALEQYGLMDDTLVIFTADNGGMPNQHGNNYPLRGAKSTIFEGGTRASSFVFGNGIEKSGYTYNGLMHAVDWNPTILAAAGTSNPDASSIDGINMWDSISKGLNSNRTELVYNLDNAFLAQQGHAAIRVGNFKLIDGFPGPFPNWYKPDELYVDENEADILNTYDENSYYDNISQKSYSRNRLLGQGLYNLAEDPTEHFDLSEQFPDVVKQLKEKLDMYRKQLVEPTKYKNDPAASPDNFNGWWSPGWC